MVRTGGTVALIAPHPLSGERTPPGRGQLVVDAPADAPLVIHASYAAVHIRDVKGSVRVAATHGRAKMLNTTGQVDAIAFVIDFAGSGGRVTLSAGARDQYETIQCAFRWDAPGLGAAIRQDARSPWVLHALSRHRGSSRGFHLSYRVFAACQPRKERRFALFHLQHGQQCHA